MPALASRRQRPRRSCMAAAVAGLQSIPMPQASPVQRVGGGWAEVRRGGFWAPPGRPHCLAEPYGRKLQEHRQAFAVQVFFDLPDAQEPEVED